MRLLLVIALLVLFGCSSVDVPPRDPMQEDSTKLRTYGVGDAFVMRGPDLKRTAQGLTTCESGDPESPCEVYSTMGEEPFGGAIRAITVPFSNVITTGAALLLGRDEIPESPVPQGLNDDAGATPVDRYGGP